MVTRAPPTSLKFRVANGTPEEREIETVCVPIHIEDVPTLDTFKNDPNPPPDGFLKVKVTSNTLFLGEVKHSFTVFFYADENMVKIGVFVQAEEPSNGTVVDIQHVTNSSQRGRPGLPSLTLIMTKGPPLAKWKGTRNGHFFYQSGPAFLGNNYVSVILTSRKRKLDFVNAKDIPDDEGGPPAAEFAKIPGPNHDEPPPVINGFPYYLSSEFSDATIECQDGTTIPVHRLILSCRSEYFAKLFGNEMEESKTGRIRIPDFQTECVKELLRYLYTGESGSMSTQLFIAADKYGLPELKLRCEKYLIEILNPDNAVEVYELGRLHGSQDMVEKGKRVVFSNKDEIIKDAGAVKEFAVNYPDLVFDLLKIQ